MIPDPSMCELPRYQRASAQYPVAQVKWQAYVNWARETGDPWAYWNQWHLYAQKSAFEAEGLAVLKEGVTKGCRLCAAGVAEYYLEQLEKNPTAPEQAQWQQTATDYLAIARQGTLACEPGTELLILDKDISFYESERFKQVIAKMSPMNSQEQRDYYKACLKLGSEMGIAYAARSYSTSGEGPEHDVMLAAASIQAIANAMALREQDIHDEMGIAVRFADAATHFKKGQNGFDEDNDKIIANTLENAKLMGEIIQRAKIIEKKFPYWGVRTYKNPAIQTINQRFYTLDEMRDAGIHFSFDPPKEQADN